MWCVGTELQNAVEAGKELEKAGKKIRVVSMPIWELFQEQTQVQMMAKLVTRIRVVQDMRAKMYRLNDRLASVFSKSWHLAARAVSS